jgi:hypothetical protein
MPLRLILHGARGHQYAKAFNLVRKREANPTVFMSKPSESY